MSTIMFTVETRDRGIYADNIQYERFDEVVYNGIHYVAIRSTGGHMPMDRGYWRTLAETEEFDEWMGVTDERLDDVEIDTADLYTIVAEKSTQGVLTGLVVAQQTSADMSVKVSAGVLYADDGTRIELAAVASVPVDDADATKPRLDAVYVDPDGAVAYLASELGTAAVAGAKTFTITTNFVATDTATIGGQEFTAVASDPTAAQFVPGADAAATAVTLGAKVAANATIAALYDVDVAGAAITLTELDAGGGDTPADATTTGTGVISSGTATTSAAAVLPDAPELDEGSALLAHVQVDAGATTIVTAKITDKRVMQSMRRTVSAAPTTAPDRVGVLLLDTTHGKAYLSMGTSAASDWKEITFVTAE